MRLVIVAAVAALLIQPALGQSNRFAPDNPWFRDFEKTCRDDASQRPMDPVCREGVLEGLRAWSENQNVDCDWYMFWAAADAIRSPTFEVLPWQTAVEHIFAQGVCVSW